MSNLSEIQLKIIAGIDGLVEIGKLINELDALGGQTTESSAEVEKLVSTLDNLRQQDQLISKFQTLKKGTADLSSTLDEARTRATSLGKGLADSKQQVASTNAEYRSSKTATQALADEWQAAKVKVDLLTKGIKDSASPTRAQRDELKAAKEQAKLLGEQYKASSKETATLDKALRSTEQALKLQTREFNAARKEVNQLDEQYIKQSGTLNGLRTQLQQSGLNTKQLAAEQRGLKAATEQAEQEIAGLAKQLRNQAGDQQWVNEQLKAGEQQLKEYGAAADKTKNSTADLHEKTGGFTSSVVSLTGKLVALAGAYVGIQAIKDSLVSLFQAGDKAEQLGIQMTAVMGSIENGQQATAWIKKFAKDTPLQLNEVTETFIRLKSMGLDPMDGTMQAVVDQSSKLGIGFEGLQGVTLALGQAWSKGKLQAEEMNQMIERGVPVMALLSQATGKTTAELQAMSQSGLLGRDAIKALISEMGNQSVGAANAQMSTMSGLLSNLGDSWTEFKTSVANAGVLEWAKNQLQELSNTINQMANDGRLQQYAKQVSDWLVTTGEATKQFILDIGGSFDGLIAGTNAAVQSLRIVFNLFTGTVKGLAVELLKPTYAIAKILDSVADLAEAMGQNGLAGKIRESSGLMKAEYNAFATSLQEDANDIIDATSKMAGGQESASVIMAKAMQNTEAQSKSSIGAIQSHYLGLRETTEQTNSAISDLFAKAGIDLEQASGRVSSTVQDFVFGLNAIANSAEVNGQATKAYLDKAFDSAHNVAEIKALTNSMQELHDKGKLVGAPYIESLAQATEAAKKLSKESAAGAAIYIDLLNKQKEAAKEAYASGKMSAEEYRQTVGKVNKELEKTTKQQKANADAADEAAGNYEQLGIKSAAALEKLAAENKKAYAGIKLTGDSLAVQRQAFLVYAESELEAAAATGRYADASLYAQAATLGLSDQLVALIQSIDATGSSADQTSEQLRELLRLQNQVNGTGEKPQKTVTEQNAENIQKAMEATRAGAQAAAAYIGNYSSALQQMAKDMSAQTESMMSNIMGWTRGSSEASSAVSTLNQKLADNAAQWREIRSAVTLDDIQGHIKDLGLAYLASERAYLKQALAAEKMTAQLTDVDNVTAKSVKRAEGLYNNLDMLDEQDLSGLRSAIDSARSKMDQLESSARNTLNSLRDELDQYNGALDAIEERDYETKLAALQAQLVAAKTAQDAQAIADTKESMAILKELHKQKMQDIAEEAAAKRAAAAEEAASAATAKKSATISTGSSSANATSTSSTQSTAVSKTIELKLGQSSAKVQVTPEQEQNLDKLLDQLAAAKGITL
ncbi:tape measure protein [Pseudaeromonas pectinilytica]